MGENSGRLLAVLRENLLPYCGENVVFIVGFSGGRDSLGLLWGLHELARGEWRGRFSLLAAHFNHNLRGADALADEVFCREFCRERGIEYVADKAQDLSAEMSNLEQRARDARYNWFAELKCERERDGQQCYLLTAHHLEDQAETVLLHLLRGAGTAGLAAMRAENGWQLRPLLGLPRAVLQDALAEQGLCWRDDATNECLDYTRNFLRAQVLPVLRDVNPRADRALVQAAEIAAAEADYFDNLVEEKLCGALRCATGQVCYPWAELAAEPLAVRRRLVRALWCRLTGRVMCPLSLVQVDAVLGLAAGSAVHLTGAVLALRRRGQLILRLPTAEELAARQRKSRKGQK